jgi:hypothetical protein
MGYTKRSCGLKRSKVIEKMIHDNLLDGDISGDTKLLERFVRFINKQSLRSIEYIYGEDNSESFYKIFKDGISIAFNYPYLTSVYWEGSYFIFAGHEKFWVATFKDWFKKNSRS